MATNPVILLMFVKFIVIFGLFLLALFTFLDWDSYNFGDRMVENVRNVGLLALFMIALSWVSLVIYQYVVLGSHQELFILRF